jgi:hypothetical protein
MAMCPSIPQDRLILLHPVIASRRLVLDGLTVACIFYDPQFGRSMFLPQARSDHEIISSEQSLSACPKNKGKFIRARVNTL